jgi:hypothetical protein
MLNAKTPQTPKKLEDYARNQSHPKETLLITEYCCSFVSVKSPKKGFFNCT